MLVKNLLDELCIVTHAVIDFADFLADTVINVIPDLSEEGCQPKLLMDFRLHELGGSILDGSDSHRFGRHSPERVGLEGMEAFFVHCVVLAHEHPHIANVARADRVIGLSSRGYHSLPVFLETRHRFPYGCVVEPPV